MSFIIYDLYIRRIQRWCKNPHNENKNVESSRAADHEHWAKLWELLMLTGLQLGLSTGPSDSPAGWKGSLAGTSHMGGIQFMSSIWMNTFKFKLGFITLMCLWKESAGILSGFVVLSKYTNRKMFWEVCYFRENCR